MVFVEWSDKRDFWSFDLEFLMFPWASPAGIHGIATVPIMAEERVDHRVEPGDDEYEPRQRPGRDGGRTNN
jgi:hypothetical protein